MLAVAVRGGRGRSTGQLLQAVEVQRLGLLPREAGATKVTVAAGRLVDRLAQLQLPAAERGNADG